ncbi:MAG: helix-turn-helix transcriptional regulator [Anaerolineae bacterium]|nr:helix-turn-helix transcriptional regulator [Anaerolineae bacterium]NUQ05419.1 helix-turn-helix transcriptional regulator [Anaerolineae bacterium]
MTAPGEHVEQLRLELRRGIVVLAVLSLMDSASYGYNLIQRLAGLGLAVEEGTLYPLLRRLEKQGLLQSEWDTTESRPRKYYRISADGREVLTALRAEWQETVTVMQNILERDRHE